jgi:hypothetical protein
MMRLDTGIAAIGATPNDHHGLPDRPGNARVGNRSARQQAPLRPPAISSPSLIYRKPGRCEHCNGFQRFSTRIASGTGWKYADGAFSFSVPGNGP